LKSSPEQAEIDALQTSDHLLKGLLFDDAGHRMIATHATKAGVRHRYYVSKPALHGEARIAKLGSVSRVPPSEIEGSSNLPSANTSSSSDRKPMPFRRRCSITLRLPLSEPAAGNGIFGAGDRRLRASRRDYGADAAASSQLNRQFNSPSGPVRASISLSARVVVFSL
jgi:hypothetical protein